MRCSAKRFSDLLPFHGVERRHFDGNGVLRGLEGIGVAAFAMQHAYSSAKPEAVLACASASGFERMSDVFWCEKISGGGLLW